MHGELAAHRRQHALPLDLRQQRRGRARPRALPRLLPARRARGDRAPDGRHAPLRGAAPDASIPNVGASGAIVGRARRVLPAPAARAGADGIFLVFFFLVEIPAVFFLGIWIVFQLWEGGFSILHPAGGRRRRLLRAHRRLRLRGADRAPLHGHARAATAALLMVTLRGARPARARLAAAGARARARERRGRRRGREPARSPTSRPLRRRPESCRRRSSIYRRPLEEDFPDPAELEHEIRDHRPPRARALLRDRRGPPRRARLRVSDQRC